MHWDRGRTQVDRRSLPDALVSFHRYHVDASLEIIQ